MYKYIFKLNLLDVSSSPEVFWTEFGGGGVFGFFFVVCSCHLLFFSSSTVLQIYEILGESIFYMYMHLMETQVSMPLYKGDLLVKKEKI